MLETVVDEDHDVLYDTLLGFDVEQFVVVNNNNSLGSHYLNPFSYFKNNYTPPTHPPPTGLPAKLRL